MKSLIFISIFIFINVLCFSQTTSIRLSVIKGNRVIFNFESYKDIKNGKTLGTPPTGFTEIQIDYKQDVDFSSLGWVLTVRANTANLTPDYGATALNLDAINLYTYLDGVYQTTIPLTISDQVIATMNAIYPPVAPLPVNYTNSVTIIYDCGILEELIGMQSDVFSTDLIFIVQSQ